MVSPVLFETEFDMREVVPTREPEKTLMSYLDEAAKNGCKRRLNLGLSGPGLVSLRHPSIRLSAIVEEEAELLQLLHHSPLKQLFDNLGVTLVKSKFSALPFREGAFHLVTVSDALGRDNIDTVLKELHRVTERFAIFSVRNSRSLDIPVLGFRKEHLYPRPPKSFSPKEFEESLKPYFSIRQIRTNLAGRWLTVLGERNEIQG
ncbi:MAG: class I SAM-dependent methyltransferase [Candidatus Altiarchaeota archaeon]|nr:class I SAM-dependent methyltransferase [Candidatus Altiarchaeota archaeon]